MKTIVLAGAALAALAAAAASAQPPRDEPARVQTPRMAGPLTRAAVEARVQAHFARLDANRDGFVTQDEIQARRPDMREGFGPRRGGREGFGARRGGGDRAALFARLDANRDGVLSREEFLARPAFGDRAGRGPREGFGPRRGGRGGFAMGGRAFERLDANRDGRVSLAEAREGALRMFDRADANRDGVVTPDERRAARQALRAQRRG